jgi:hypothetical protein
VKSRYTIDQKEKLRASSDDHSRFNLSHAFAPERTAPHVTADPLPLAQSLIQGRKAATPFKEGTELVVYLDFHFKELFIPSPHCPNFAGAR